MLAGDLYTAADDEIQRCIASNQQWLARYNASMGSDASSQYALLAEGLKTVGIGVVLRPPFYCDYGFNIEIGRDVFINFGCTFLDVVSIKIGDKTQIGPQVQILTADHPRDPAAREAGLEFGRPVVIGRNVWLGAGAIILPGVVIGDDAIVGAGSVVTRNVAPGTTVVGNPARAR